MKIGLVELVVDASEFRSEPSRDMAIKKAIAASSVSRRRAIEAAVALGRDDYGCDLLVLPGWTLIGRKPPLWLLAAAGTMPVVCEMLPRAAIEVDDDKLDVAADLFIVTGAGVQLGPIRQRAVYSSDLRRSKTRDSLVADLRTNRRWRVGRNDALVFVCGEVNLVRGGGSSRHLRVEALRADEVQAPLVINPAHTPSRLPAMRDKRAWLSENGCLLTTANIVHGLARARTTAMEAWERGTCLFVREREPDAVGEHFTLRVIDVGRPPVRAGGSAEARPARRPRNAM